MLVGDGNGWVTCLRGHRHWGRYGAAGLLVTDGTQVLLQHRAPWTHEGNTWALPGGARDSHEQPLDAALREVAEETSLDVREVVPVDEWVDDHGGWSYTTIVARAGQTVTGHEVHPANEESTQLRWFLVERVAALPLHDGFAAAWPALRRLLPLH